MSSIGERLAEAINAAGLTPYSLSKKVGISESTLSRIIRGISKPNLSTIILISRSLSVNWKWLETGEGDKDNLSDQAPLVNEGDLDHIHLRLSKFIRSKDISASELASVLSISLKNAFNILNGNVNIPSDVSIRLLEKYPDLNANWLFTGKGAMMKGSETNVSDSIPLPEPGEEHELELIKREDHTEFRRLSDDKYLVVTPLISQYAYAGYVSGWADPEYIEDMPRHAVVMNELTLGIYRSMEVRGDSMDNGKKGCIAEGDIVTGRKLYQKHWRNKLHLHKYKYYIIVTDDGIVIKQILEHFVEEGKILCHSLNPDKETYPDYELSLEDVREIYYIKAVTEPYN